MELKHEIEGVKDARLINQVTNNRPSPTHVKRIELDSYTPSEMELYLFFQGYGRSTPDNVLC